MHVLGVITGGWGGERGDSELRIQRLITYAARLLKRSHHLEDAREGQGHESPRKTQPLHMLKPDRETLTLSADTAQRKLLTNQNGVTGPQMQNKTTQVTTQ